MILAAGYGTRLQPLTHVLPKPMVPLCNRPLLAWAVESFLSSGIRDLIINVHHLPAPIEQFLQETYAQRAKLYVSVEDSILGTGGAVRRVRTRLDSEELFFLVNGDTVQFPKYEELARSLRSRESIAALTLRHPPEEDRFTAVQRDPSTGLVAGFGRGSGEPLMFAGSHAVSRRIFDYLPDRDFSGIVEHVYQPLLETGRETIAGVVDDGLWFDIGTPERYLSASAGVLGAIVRGQIPPPDGSRVAGDSLHHESARVEGSLSRSVADARSVIGGDVRDSIIWSDCRIAPHVTLDRCIVASGVTLDRAIHLRNALICAGDDRIPSEYPRLDGLVIVDIGR